MLRRSESTKRDPTSPLQNDEVKKARSWAEVVMSDENSIPTVMEAVGDDGTVGDGHIEAEHPHMHPQHYIIEQSSMPIGISGDIDYSYIVKIVTSILEPSISAMVTGAIQAAMNPFQAELQKVRQENIDLQQENVKLKTRVTNLETHLDDLEQYSRRNCLRISGIAERKDENTDNIIVKLAKDLGSDLSISDIDRSHRVGRPSTSGRPRQIIVKLISYRARASLYDKRRVMKNAPVFQNIFINEDLTPKRNQMLFEARQAVKRKEIIGAWSFDGKIFIRDKRDVRRQLVEEGDLELYIERSR